MIDRRYALEDAAEAYAVYDRREALKDAADALAYLGHGHAKGKSSSRST